MADLEHLDSPHILEAGDTNFADIVLRNSAIGPILVNFWSPKAGPCLRLYPVLDKLTREAGGKFLLVNVNVNRKRRTACDYGIASVPTLKLFRNGQAVDTRHGYQDETSLRQALAVHLARLSDLALREALAAYSENPTPGMRLMAEAALEDPGNTRIPATLAKLLVKESRYGEAWRLLDGLPETAREELSQLYVHLSLIRAGWDAPDRAALQAQLAMAPADDDARFHLAANFVLSDDYESALAELLVLARRQPPFRNGLARMAMLALLNLLGQEHPLSTQYRAELSRFVH